MRPEDLVFWLDALRSGSTEHGVLCRRHADTMVVPRGWTLDDLRDPDLHLFRPPSDDSGSIRRPRARRSSQPNPPEQLALGVEAASDGDVPAVEPAAVVPPAASVADDPVVEEQIDGGDQGVASNDDGHVEPWMPVFDTSDDLDGLLAARSPLLSRAFRGERGD